MADILTTRKPADRFFSRIPTAPSHGRGTARPQRSEPAVAGATLKARLRLLLDALKAARQGNFSVRLPEAHDGILGEIAQTFNEVIGLNESMANEIARVSKIISEEGKLTERASLQALRDVGHQGRFRQYPHRQPRTTDDGSGARDHRRRPGGFVEEDDAGNPRGPSKANSCASAPS